MSIYNFSKCENYMYISRFYGKVEELLLFHFFMSWSLRIFCAEIALTVLLWNILIASFAWADESVDSWSINTIQENVPVEIVSTDTGVLTWENHLSGESIQNTTVYSSPDLSSSWTSLSSNLPVSTINDETILQTWSEMSLDQNIQKNLK